MYPCWGDDYCSPSLCVYLNHLVQFFIQHIIKLSFCIIFFCTLINWEEDINMKCFIFVYSLLLNSVSKIAIVGNIESLSLLAQLILTQDMRMWLWRSHTRTHAWRFGKKHFVVLFKIYKALGYESVHVIKTSSDFILGKYQSHSKTSRYKIIYG